MSTFRSLKTAPGAVVVQIGRRAFFVRTVPVSKVRAKRTAEHTRALMEGGEHFVLAATDLGFLVACELVETMIALEGAVDDEPRRDRLMDEANRFALSLQQYEEHPFVFIHHDREEMMTRIEPMRDINSLAAFDAWEASRNIIPGARITYADDRVA